MARLTAIVGLLTVASLQAAAQDGAEEADLTIPPQISDAPAPGDASLEPAPEEREDMLEAVVTGGQTDFRLPDLGTSLRDDEEERDPNQRFDVTFLNLYDPDNIDPAEEAFPSLEEKLGVGMLRIFEVRFRGRERD
ncbi:MAG: hypothetical protein PVH89_01990 [Gammaproteobacteria bacterium]|jgi:hypothetical protein